MNQAIAGKSIGFIGAGVMGAALIKSLLDSSVKSTQIYISEKNRERAKEVTSSFHVELKGISEIGQICDVIFLAVKPQDLESTLKDLSGNLRKDALLISIAAGKSTKFIESQIKSKNSVVRVMPNTPAQIGQGVCVISAGANSSKNDLDLTKALLENTGLVVEVDESQQDAVTALSGSGPAYFFAFVESIIKSGVSLGLSLDIATKLAIGTITGSAAMLNESGLDAATLRKNVTSPNGTTAAALEVFNANKLEEIIHEAMSAAKKRSQELA